MIRNSTDKFRNKYEKSIGKTHGSTTSLNFNHHHPHHPLTNRTSQVSIKPSKSMAKLQTTKTILIRSLKSQVSSHFRDNLQLDFNNTGSSIDHFIKKKGINASTFSKQKNTTKRIFSTLNLNRQPEQFIDNLKKNQLFFCCQCYQYIYQIEKKRHFPDCKDRIAQLQRSNVEEIALIAHERLERIMKLAKYTNNKSAQIQDLYKSYQNGSFLKLQGISYPTGISFYTFQQIDYAFLFIYNKLVKDIKKNGNKMINFSLCHCV